MNNRAFFAKVDSCRSLFNIILTVTLIIQLCYIGTTLYYTGTTRNFAHIYYFAEKQKLNERNCSVVWLRSAPSYSLSTSVVCSTTKPQLLFDDKLPCQTSTHAPILQRDSCSLDFDNCVYVSTVPPTDLDLSPLTRLYPPSPCPFPGPPWPRQRRGLKLRRD